MDEKFDQSGLATISGSHLFKSLDESGRNRLFTGATNLQFGAGQIIVREGDPGEALYLIRQGEVEVYTTKDGNKVDLSHLSPGGCFGEVALLSGQPRTATVAAITDCKLLCFPKKQIEDILEEYPKVKQLLKAIVVGRAEDTVKKITKPPTR